MVKEEFIEMMATETGRTKKDVSKFIEEFTDMVVKGLEKDGKINLQPLGIMELRQREARLGRNPQTGEDMDIPASKAPKLKFASSIKNKLK